MKFRWHERLNSDTNLAFRGFLNDKYNAQLSMDNLPIGTEIYLKERYQWNHISRDEAAKIVFSKIWISEEQARVEFEVSLYSNVDHLAQAIAMWDGWVFRLISMSREKLKVILDSNTSLDLDEKQILLERNMLSGSWEMLSSFDLTKKESKLLTDFVLSGYPEWYAWKIEDAMKKEEFARAYKFIIRERLFSESFTSSHASISTVYNRDDRKIAVWVDKTARKWITYH
jgi:hypothetical protein